MEGRILCQFILLSLPNYETENIRPLDASPSPTANKGLQQIGFKLVYFLLKSVLGDKPAFMTTKEHP